MWMPNGQSGGYTYLRDPITGATGIADQFGNVSTDGGRTYTSNLGMPLQQFLQAGSNEAALRQSNAPATQQGAPTQGFGNPMVQQPTQGWGGQMTYGGAGGQAPGGYPQMPGYPQYQTYPNARPANLDRYYGGPAMSYAGNPGAGQTQYGGNAAMYGGAPGQAPGQPSRPTYSAQPYQNISVPLANQMNPAVWDSLSPMGKQLAYGAIGQTGQDAGEYEYALNKARPQGQASRMTRTGYAPQQNLFSGGF